ncbi:sigma-54-dependent transcriptional regulator [Dissulfurimicrobium hydrothermale]|uniref:sigma-54-dependent transcriptional regulator n=1 Tax=Dissulfurimicrobium hydrothermale TaxID=1750598 RepID=UPI001EDB6BBB|nr:sigma-54 dependent transcriptional regulator [Dissulfurimicrobium hydrothermale]UKL13170.1 sigma-54 dependent transcriptional regulator [Dissulfurimicrobium hydrothermale]
MKKNILIVEDNKRLAELFAQALSERFNTKTVCTFKEAEKTAFNEIHGALLDIQLPDGDGLGLIRPIKAGNPSCIVIVVTAYGTIQKAVEAIRLGATDFLEKPVDIEAMCRLFAEHIPLEDQLNIIAASHQMKEVLKTAELAAPTMLPVLITGETGTGKDMLARFIHRESGRAGFIAINCANLTPELADSLLFGHIKGSFTGANETRQGLIANANNGTLFLDEIGDLPPAVQPKFLRFLDSGLYMPIGASIEHRSNTRVIAATNRELNRESGFREDLFYRLSSLPIHVPPLRERPDDIIPLACLRIQEIERMSGGRITIERDAEALLLQYDYPGNVRELFNIIDRASVFTKGNITAESLKLLLMRRDDQQEKRSEGKDGLWSETKKETLKKEKRLIQTALEATGGNKAAAARMLKISYKTLLNRLKQFGL